MKPNFALTLNPDGIALLHRVKDGWHSVGEVSLDDADWSEKLSFLRQTASALDKEGITSKLVIPSSQILYTTLTAPGPTDAERRAQIRIGLEGLTPYKVDDLRFDWRADQDPDSGYCHVAAIAQETLLEAEVFARDHGFNPLCFAAVAPEKSFQGTVYFGLSSIANELLEPGEYPALDMGAVTHITQPQTTVDTIPTTRPTMRPTMHGPRVETTTPTDPGAPDIGALPNAPETHQISLTQVPDGTPPPKTESKTDIKTGTVAFSTQRNKTAQIAPNTPHPDTSHPDAPHIEGPSLRQDVGADARAMKPAAETNAKSAPPQHVGADVPANMRVGVTDGVLPEFGDTAGVPKSGPKSGATGEITWHKPHQPVATPRIPQAAPPPIPVSNEGPDTPTTTPTTRMRAKPPAQHSQPQLSPTPSPFMLVPSKKRRVITITGLILAAIVIGTMVAAALWLTGFPDKKTTPTGAKIGPEAAVSALPDITPPVAQRAGPASASAKRPSQLAQIEPQYATPPNAPQQTIILPPAAIEQPANPPNNQPASDAGPVAPQTPPRMVARPSPEPTSSILAPGTTQLSRLSPQEAETAYGNNGIWQRAPMLPALPAEQSLASTYIASIDAKLPIPDAVALPRVSLLSDSPPPSQATPAPPEKQFLLDNRGFVIPTAQGTLNPDGILVIKGAPPTSPPARGTRVPRVISPPVDLRLARKAPKSRPSNLIQVGEMARFGGLTRRELAAKRPVSRPLSAQDAGQVSAPAGTSPTAQAVTRSLVPGRRPAQFAKTVAIRRAAASSQPKDANRKTKVTVLAKPSTTRIPTSASVARHATVKNAINLNRINLIGVYGTASNRRALLRLAGGRYVKVKVGDRVNGGKVIAISNNAMRYIKGGRNIILKLPKT